MGNITKIEDCIVESEGQRRCVYCGAVLDNGAVCNCARFVNTCEKLAKAEQCAEKVELWAAKRQQYLDAIYPPRYAFRMTLVRLEDETAGDDGGNGGSTSDGSGDDGVTDSSGSDSSNGSGEPTEGGGE